MKFRGNYEVTKKITSEDLEVSKTATLKDITASSVVLDGTGSADLGGSELLNVGTPTDATAAINKQYFENNMFSISTGATPPTDAVDGDLFIAEPSGASRIPPSSIQGTTPKFDIASNGSRVMIVANNESSNIVAASDDNMNMWTLIDAGFNTDDTHGSSIIRAAGGSEWVIWPSLTSQGKSRGRYTANNGSTWKESESAFGGAADSWNDEAIDILITDPDHTTGNASILAVSGRPLMYSNNDGSSYSWSGQTAPTYISGDVRADVSVLLRDDHVTIDRFIAKSFRSNAVSGIPSVFPWSTIMMRSNGNFLLFNSDPDKSGYVGLCSITSFLGAYQPAAGQEAMEVSGAVDNVDLDVTIVWSETKKTIWYGNAAEIETPPHLFTPWEKATIIGDLANFPTKIVSHGTNGFVGINETTGITSWSTDGINWTISIEPSLGKMKFHKGEWVDLPYTQEQDVLDLITTSVDLSGYLPKTGGTLTGDLTISGSTLDFQGLGANFVTINDAKMSVGTTDTVFQNGTFAIKSANPLIENGNLTVDSGNISVTNGNIEVIGGSTIVGDFKVADNSTILVGASSTVNLNGNKILGLADPTNPQDAATKAYVDGIPDGINTFYSQTLPNSQADGDIAFTYIEGVDRSPNAANHDPSFTTSLHYDLGFGPDKIFVTNGTTAYKYSLDNGEIWLDGTFPTAVSRIWYSGNDNGEYYAFPTGGENTAYISFDGDSWIGLPFPVDADHVANSNTPGDLWNISPEVVYLTSGAPTNYVMAVTIGDAVVKDVNVIDPGTFYTGNNFSSANFANITSTIHQYKRGDDYHVVTALSGTNIVGSNGFTEWIKAAPTVANVTWTDHANLGWVWGVNKEFALLFGTGTDSHKAMYRTMNNGFGTWNEFDATGGIPLNARTSALSYETGRMVIVGDEGFFYADFGVPNSSRMFESDNFLSALQAGGFFNQATYSGDLASLPDALYTIPGSDYVYGINSASGAVTYSADGGINWVAVAKEITQIHIADSGGWQTIEPLRPSSADEIYAKRTGSQYSGTLDMNNNNLIGIPTPGGDDHAVPKIYVDDLAGHVEVANSVAIHGSITSLLVEVPVNAEPCLFIDVLAKNNDGSKAYMATYHALRNSDGSEMSWSEFGTIRIGGADVHIELNTDALGNIEIRGRSATEQYKVKMKIRKMDV